MYSRGGLLARQAARDGPKPRGHTRLDEPACTQLHLRTPEATREEGVGAYAARVLTSVIRQGELLMLREHPLYGR